ncbi:MAG: hypothetical protein ACK4K7_06245 [Allosphingosinicella sp.]|uniref:hypothetical protein n=1 Tax=Allosphingosinicella sp. TaxID=2823234 RepID=UPI00392AAB9C
MKTYIIAAAALLASGAAVAQTGQAVETDARGIPVVSMPAEAPAGANQTPPAGAAQVVPAPNQGQVFAPRQATEEFPPCTRERTDRCVQTYERGRSPRR